MSRTVSTHIRKMHRITLKALLVGALSIGLLHSAVAQNKYWQQYGSLPVLMQQQNNGSTQVLKFVTFKDGLLVAELDGGVGEVSLPVSESMVKSLRLAVDTEKARALVDAEDYTTAVTLLRPEVYPLIKFHQVPDTFVALHVPIQLLINTLIRAGELSEAEDIINRISLIKVGISYSQCTIRLMNAYIAAKDFNSAARIAKILPVDGIYTPNMSAVADAADALRGAGQFDEVIPLYRAMEEVVTGETLINVRMWLAYSLVLSDNLAEATPMIEAMVEPEPKERLFSLYKLLQGSKAHREERYKDALDLLTRGFVRAQTSYVWVPEMLYLIGDCYARAEDNIAARNVWTEIVILYPDSPWAENAQTSLDKLPKS